MNLFLSIFMYLSVLQFCASEPDQCIVELNEEYDDTTIYLIVPKATFNEDLESYNDFQKLLNKKYMNKHQQAIPYTLKIIPEFCPGGVEGILKASQYIPNLINLFVNDFFEFNYATILEKNLFYAGKTRLKKDNANCTDNGLEPIPDMCYDAKIISASITDFKDLLELTLCFWSANTDTCRLYLEDFPDDKPQKPAILVCLEDRYNDTLDSRTHNIEIIYKDPNTCMTIINSVQDSARLIAIVAEKTFDMNFEVSIPTLFYNRPYLSYEEKAKFPNSISVNTQWKPLTRAFVKFMREMGWSRVAMISDDSEYSEEFEVEMSRELQRQDFAYHSYVCSNKICDFDEMVNSMLNAKARVIILNIGERNSQRYLQSINKNDARLRYLVWLVRDWPLPEEFPLEYRPKKFYSLSLGIDYTKYEQEYLNNFKYLDDLPQINRMNAGIDKILLSYRKLSVQNNEALTSLRKKLNSKLASIPMDENVLAFITEVKYYQKRLEMILKITQNNSKVDIIMSRLRHIEHFDRIKCDMLNNNSYSEPCGDQDILLLFLVIIVFFAVVLLLIYYINQVAYTISYTQF